MKVSISLINTDGADYSMLYPSPQEGYGVIVLNTNHNTAGPGDTPIKVRKLINFMITMYVCMYVCVCVYVCASSCSRGEEGGGESQIITSNA